MALLNKLSSNVIYNPNCPEVFWEAVKEQLSKNQDIKMGIPKGKAYSVVHSQAHKGFLGYCFTYSVKDEKRWYKAELKNGEQYYTSKE